MATTNNVVLGNGTVVVSTFDGDAAAKHAAELASKAGALDTVLDVIADAKQEMAGGPVKVLIALRTIYGDDLDGFPRPGEKEGNNRDEITVDVTVNGETKAKKTTFYTVFADNTPAGKKIVDTIAMIKRAGNPEAMKDGIPEHITELVASGGADRQLKYLETRRQTFRASIKRAMELVFQFNAMAEVPLVECSPIWEDGKEGEETIASQTPIQVWQMNEDGKRVKYTKDLTVSTFLKIDAKRAAELGGGFKNVMKTLERGTKTDGTTAATGPTIKTTSTFIGTAIIEGYRYADELIRNKDTADYDRLIKGLKSDKTADETVDAFVGLRNYLNDIIKAAELQQRWQKMQLADKAA